MEFFEKKTNVWGIKKNFWTIKNTNPNSERDKREKPKSSLYFPGLIFPNFRVDRLYGCALSKDAAFRIPPKPQRVFSPINLHGPI